MHVYFFNRPESLYVVGIYIKLVPVRGQRKKKKKNFFPLQNFCVYQSVTPYLYIRAWPNVKNEIHRPRAIYKFIIYLCIDGITTIAKILGLFFFFFFILVHLQHNTTLAHAFCFRLLLVFIDIRVWYIFEFFCTRFWFSLTLLFVQKV